MAKLVVFLASATLLCYLALVRAQTDRRCPTAGELVRRGCNRRCVTVTRESFPCPFCQEGCTDVQDECVPRSVSGCLDNQVCVAAGVGGRYSCVNRTLEGEVCSTLDDLSDRISGVSIIPCLAGLVCKRVQLDSIRSECRPLPTGPCTMARENGVECDGDGNFVVVQCREDTTTGSFSCRCVDPVTGVMVPNSRQQVSSPKEARCRAPTCEFRSNAGVSFSVPSGVAILDTERCVQCLCQSSGERGICSSLSRTFCEVVNPPQNGASCDIRGRRVPSGETITVNCNRCKCSDGEVVCTKRLCERDDEEDDDDEKSRDDEGEVPEEEKNCRACGAMRAEPVCGADGRTYPSECFATSCRGLNASKLIPGPCSRRNICDRFPCDGDEVCITRRAVTCLSSEGCSPERLRYCVDPLAIRCRSRDGDSEDEDGTESPDAGTESPDEGDESNGESSDGDDDEMVCGDDGRTYASLCNLVQDSLQTDVAYDGSCNRTECIGGEVCGTDGETYSSICELRFNSGNARPDYRGACEEEEDDNTVNNKCMRLRRSGRCAAIAATCRARVLPDDGCCPICGGGVTFRLIREAVDEYARRNPDSGTVEDFLDALISSGFIPEDILRRCEILASLLDTGDFHLVLEEKEMQLDGMMCNQFANRIAERINNPRNLTEAASYPQILQLAVVAETAPVVGEDGTGMMTTASVDGAMPVASFGVAAMLIPMLLMALFM